MRIALLARNPDLYSHRRLMEAATARGHEIEHISTLKCYMNITSQRLAAVRESQFSRRHYRRVDHRAHDHP